MLTGSKRHLRFMSLEDLPYRGRFDAGGRPLCGICGATVPHGRREWCSDACVQEYLRRSDIDCFRRAVWERDHGRCEMCGAVQRSRSWRRGWQVDDVVPIADGGDAWDMANLRSLCVPCHRSVTAVQNRERNKRRAAAAAR